MKRISISILSGILFAVISFTPVFAADIDLKAFFTEEQLAAVGPATEELIKEQLSQLTTKEALEREVSFLKRLLDKRSEKLGRRMFAVLKMRRQNSIKQWRREQMQNLKELKGKARLERLREIKKEQLARKDRMNEMVSAVKAEHLVVVKIESVDAANNVILTTRMNKDVRVGIVIKPETQLTKFDAEGKRIAATFADFKAGDRVMAVVKDGEKPGEFIGINVMNITK